MSDVDVNNPDEVNHGSHDEFGADFLSELRAQLRASDPIPRRVTEYAKLALSLNDLDVMIAELIDERELVSVRDSSGISRVVFDLKTSTVQLDLLPEQILGTLSNSGWRVSIRVANSTTATELDVEDGVFFECRRPGDPFQFILADGSNVFSTQWII